jgi:hypothetical protein
MHENWILKKGSKSLHPNDADNKNEYGHEEKKIFENAEFSCMKMNM